MRLIKMVGPAKLAGAVVAVTGFTTQKEFGKLVSDRRQQLVLTGGEKGLERWGTEGLAKRLRVDRTTIYRFETGERWASFEKLTALLESIGLELAIIKRAGSADLAGL